MKVAVHGSTGLADALLGVDAIAQVPADVAAGDAAAVEPLVEEALAALAVLELLNTHGDDGGNIQTLTTVYGGGGGLELV